jgi:hypothetical protein
METNEGKEMKVKIKDLGIKSKPVKSGEMVSQPPEYPSMTLKLSDLGLKTIELDQDVTVTFEGDVTSINKPSEWQIKDGRYKKDDILVSIQFEKIVQDNEEDEKSISGAVEKVKAKLK